MLLNVRRLKTLILAGRKKQRREELKFEQEDFVEEQKALIQGYKEDISGEKSDIRAAQRKIKKLKEANESSSWYSNTAS